MDVSLGTFFPQLDAHLDSVVVCLVLHLLVLLPVLLVAQLLGEVCRFLFFLHVLFSWCKPYCKWTPAFFLNFATVHVFWWCHTYLHQLRSLLEVPRTPLDLVSMGECSCGVLAGICKVCCTGRNLEAVVVVTRIEQDKDGRRRWRTKKKEGEQWRGAW